MLGCGRNSGATTPPSPSRPQTSTRFATKGSDLPRGTRASLTTRRRAPCGASLRSRRRPVSPPHVHNLPPPNCLGQPFNLLSSTSPLHSTIYSLEFIISVHVKATSLLVTASARVFPRRHRSDGVFCHDSCCCSVWPLLFPSSSYVFRCGKDHEGTGTTKCPHLRSSKIVT